MDDYKKEGNVVLVKPEGDERGSDYTDDSSDDMIKNENNIKEVYEGS